MAHALFLPKIYQFQIKCFIAGELFQVGVLGCMAERLKTQLLEKEQSVDIGKLSYNRNQ